MLPLPKAEYEAPRTVDEAVRLLAEPGAMPISGGTDLIPSIKHRLFEPSLYVSTRRIAGLADIVEGPDGTLRIGAAATLRAVARHPLVLARYSALAAACGTVATPTIQNMATIGGNVMLDTRCLYYNQPAGWRAALGGCLKAEGEVCHVARTGAGCYAASSADTSPVLWCYGARLRLLSAEGPRELAISELFGEDGREPVRLRPGELLTELVLPRVEFPVVHRKLRRRGAIDYGLLLVAVRREGEGATAVLSALGPRPVEVHAERAEDLPELAWRAARPLNTHAVSTGWRKHMVRVEVRRALEACPAP